MRGDRLITHPSRRAEDLDTAEQRRRELYAEITRTGVSRAATAAALALTRPVALANRAIARHGLRPWRMAAEDYLQGLTGGGTALAGSPVEPSWDAELGVTMRRHGRAVHEESVLTALLDRVGDGACR